MSTRIATIKIGDDLPAREFHCNNVQQFFYNAALWNAHRIHFDFPYATEVEGYAGLVVAGPLMGDWLTRKAAYTGEVLRAGGKVISVNTESGRVELELQVRNEADEVVAPGAAVVRFPVT
jgi:3-methylfumaryl-CoA hydratase